VRRQWVWEVRQAETEFAPASGLWGMQGGHSAPGKCGGVGRVQNEEGDGRYTSKDNEEEIGLDIPTWAGRRGLGDSTY
jgi:hypothetical protein